MKRKWAVSLEEYSHLVSVMQERGCCKSNPFRFNGKTSYVSLELVLQNAILKVRVYSV